MSRNLRGCRKSGREDQESGPELWIEKSERWRTREGEILKPLELRTVNTKVDESSRLPASRHSAIAFTTSMAVHVPSVWACSGVQEMTVTLQVQEALEKAAAQKRSKPGTSITNGRIGYPG